MNFFHIYEQRLIDLEKREELVKRLPPNLEIKLRHYTNNLNEIRKELERLRSRQIAPDHKTLQNKFVKLFYCYAHEDKALHDELDKHLGNLKRQGKITVWHDRDISPGKPWEKEIIDNLNAVDIILFLITPDFMNSDFCYGIEIRYPSQ